MATLNSIDLGDIQIETSAKNSSLFNMPLPLSDSSQSILLDLFGVSRTITVDGIFTGTLTEQGTFITAIEAIQAGNQKALSKGAMVALGIGALVFIVFMVSQGGA